MARRNRPQSKLPAQSQMRLSSSRTISRSITVNGWCYQLQFINCGKARCRKLHGPYWYRFKRVDGKLQSKYVGKVLAFNVD